MIRSLTGWRYVFAVVIFLHHYLIDGKSALQAGGVIGVTFFSYWAGFYSLTTIKKTFADPGNDNMWFLESQSGQAISASSFVFRCNISARYSLFCHDRPTQSGSKPAPFAKLGSAVRLLYVIQCRIMVFIGRIVFLPDVPVRPTRFVKQLYMSTISSL